MILVKYLLIASVGVAGFAATQALAREALAGVRADAVMDGFSSGDVAPSRDGRGNERWRFDEVFCTVGFAAIVCRLVAAGEERYVQGAPAESIARGIAGPFSTLYNIYADRLTCARGPDVPSTCSFVRS